MTGTGTGDPWLGGTMRLTWVTDHLAHVLEHSEDDETGGTWTGLACPGHGLAIGSDVDNATLLRLVGQGQIADLIWEAPADFTVDQAQPPWVIRFQADRLRDRRSAGIVIVSFP